MVLSFHLQHEEEESEEDVVELREGPEHQAAVPTLQQAKPAGACTDLRAGTPPSSIPKCRCVSSDSACATIPQLSAVTCAKRSYCSDKGAVITCRCVFACSLLQGCPGRRWRRRCCRRLAKSAPSPRRCRQTQSRHAPCFEHPQWVHVHHRTRLQRQAERPALWFGRSPSASLQAGTPVWNTFLHDNDADRQYGRM